MSRDADNSSALGGAAAATGVAQLDLFVHSRAVILANEIIDALAARDAPRAATSLEQLGREEPAYHGLGALAILCHVLCEWPLASANAAEIANTVRRLETEVQPAAAGTMGERAAEFMRTFWCDLARASQGHAYDAAFAQSHCAGLFLRCGDPQAAAAAAESIPGWETLPDALRWLALARYRLAGLEACRPALFSLAWREPGRLPATLAELNDPLLLRDWRSFQSACDWVDTAEAASAAWFPAWYLIEHTSVRIDLAAAHDGLQVGSPAQTFFALAHLLDLEKRGYSPRLLAARARLRELAPELFALYMARREVGHR